MRRWLLVHAGLTNAAGVWYLLWSGIVGDVGLFAAGLAWSVHAYVSVRHANCHVHRCWRIGRYPVAGGQYKSCRHHHPDPAIRAGLRTHHLAAAHARHVERQQA